MTLRERIANKMQRLQRESADVSRATHRHKLLERISDLEKQVSRWRSKYNAAARREKQANQRIRALEAQAEVLRGIQQ